MSAERPSVMMHRRDAFGMLRSGSRTSSAASGSCSMPRKSHIANGIAKNIAPTPNGRKLLLPAVALMSSSDEKSTLPLNRA